jgi:anti-sigma regulatory factor (Ser/Thr protein kinase)
LRAAPITLVQDLAGGNRKPSQFGAEMGGNALLEAYSIDTCAAGLAERVAAGLARDGLVTFECEPSRDAVLALARRLMIPRTHRDADPDGITVICGRASLASRPGYAGFGAGELEPHTELSSAERPPALLMLACARAASSGGASFMADGAAVHAHLATSAPGLAAALARSRTAMFGDPGWPGAVFEAELDGWMTIRLRLDDLARFTPRARRAIPRLREVIAEHMVELPLQPGQGFLIDNRRMLHGRRAFSGERVMYRILGDPAPGLELCPGFRPVSQSWPAPSACSRPSGATARQFRGWPASACDAGWRALVGVLCLLAVPDIVTAVTQQRRVFDGQASQVSHARQFVKDALAGCPDLDTAVLLADELVTNALMHTKSGGGTFEVIAWLGQGSACVAVADGGSDRVPSPISLDGELESGRGLALVDALAACWGQAGNRDGRVTWFLVRWPDGGEQSVSAGGRGG